MMYRFPFCWAEKVTGGTSKLPVSGDESRSCPTHISIMISSVFVLHTHLSKRQAFPSVHQSCGDPTACMSLVAQISLSPIKITEIPQSLGYLPNNPADKRTKSMRVSNSNWMKVLFTQERTLHLHFDVLFVYIFVVVSGCVKTLQGSMAIHRTREHYCWNLILPQHEWGPVYHRSSASIRIALLLLP